MRKLICATVLATCLVSGAASATSGNDLLEQCSATKADGVTKWSVNMASCYGYISGVINTLEGLQSTEYLKSVTCIPEGVNIEELRDITVNIIKTVPEYRHYKASSLVILAMKKVFPCPE